ncbi:MAG TPA: SDR family oxidoreductase [Bradyrhizobium sp.]|nr:SDR family oxidoreductase [Bradyrhizobium sp.]
MENEFAGNVALVTAEGNAPGRAVYAASKAAVNAITKVLALELAERRIRMNAIMPGYYDTEGCVRPSRLGG